MIFDIRTELKFAYPCFSSIDKETDTKMTVSTETYLKSMYPERYEVPGMECLGENYWGNPLFRNDKGNYFTVVDGKLHSNGNDSDGDSSLVSSKENYSLSQINYRNISHEKVISDFSSFLEKGKEVILKRIDFVELESYEVSIEINESDYSRSKVICTYELKKVSDF